MQIIEIKNKKWAVGLEWEILPGEASFKEEAKEIAEKTASNYGVIVNYDSQFAIGLSKKVSPKQPSANLYLALANQEKRIDEQSNYYPDWIVVEDAGDDKYWIAIIKNGVPSPQSDSILDITTIKDRINDLLINDTYTIYSQCVEIKAIFEGTKEVEDKGLNDLTEDVKTKIKFLKLRGIPNVIIYSGVGLLFFIGLIAGVSSLIEGSTLREKRETLEREQNEANKKLDDEYTAKLKIYDEQLAKNKVDAVSKIVLTMKTNPDGVLKGWYNFVGGIETGSHGWNLNKIECYVNDIKNVTELPTSACDIKFVRTGLSTSRMLLQDYPDAIIKGDDALVSRKIEISKEYITNYGVDKLPKLATAKNWGFDMISQLQLLKIVNIEHEIKPSTSLTYTIPAAPLKPSEIKSGMKIGAETTIPLGFAKGELIIKNNNFELMQELADNVDFIGVTVKKATFEPRDLGEINWTISMDYFVREDSSGGISGSNSSGLSNNSVAGATTTINK